jgi:hypothetical protein
MTREQGTGNREEGTGNREEGRGKRGQGTGKRFWATLLFVTCVGFFLFTYLQQFSVLSSTDINIKLLWWGHPARIRCTSLNLNLL